MSEQSIVAYLQAVAPALATQLTKERLEALKTLLEFQNKLAGLEAIHESDAKDVERLETEIGRLYKEIEGLKEEREELHE